jgi:hypothetical protein
MFGQKVELPRFFMKTSGDRATSCKLNLRGPGNVEILYPLSWCEIAYDP